MKLSKPIQAAGIAIGLGLFVASRVVRHRCSQQTTIFMCVFFTRRNLPESVIAPAEQLSKAFSAVANHVKPAVVSVYSEKQCS